MSKNNSTEQLIEELSVLTFARVSKVVLADENKESSKGEVSYKYYYGFASVEKAKTDKDKKTVWFKNATHLSRNGGFFFGSVSHCPGYSKLNDIPKRGDIIVGKMIPSTKGAQYEWWTHHATPFMNFRAFIRSPRKLQNEPRAFSMLKLTHSRTQTTDDLYIMAQVLLRQNVSLLVSQLLDDKQRVRHPWLKDESGYQRKRGFELEYHVVEIAYFLSLFAKNTRIYKQFLEQLDKKKQEILDWPAAKLKEYNMDRLEKNIENVSKKKV
jgi:hypothetical protein